MSLQQQNEPNVLSETNWQRQLLNAGPVAAFTGE